MSTQQPLRAEGKHLRPRPRTNFKLDRVACPACGQLRQEGCCDTLCPVCRCSLGNQSEIWWLANQDEAVGRIQQADRRLKLANLMRRMTEDEWR